VPLVTGREWRGVAYHLCLGVRGVAENDRRISANLTENRVADGVWARRASEAAPGNGVIR
jgi:hypothetical protein